MQTQPSKLRNSLWNLADSILYPVIFLGLTPFFLNHLGAKMFGIYMLSNSIFVTIQVFNLGTAFATMRHVAHYRQSGEKDKMAMTISINLSIASVLFAATSIIGMGIALLVYCGGLFHIEGDLRQYTSICIAIASVAGGLKFSEQVLQACFRGNERFDLSGKFNITIRVGSIISNAILIYMGGSVISMLLANLVITLVMLVVQLWQVKSLLPEINLHFVRSWRHAKKELDLGVWVWLQSFVLIITSQADRYAVTYLGLDTLSYYALTATIFGQALVMISSLVPWFQPRIAGMIARRDSPMPLYKTVQALLSTGGSLAVICFFLLHEPILTVWIGPEKFVHLNEYFPLFTVFGLLSVPAIVPVAFLNASGRQRLCFRINLIMALVTIMGIAVAFYLTHSARNVIYGLIAGAAVYMPLMQYAVYINTGTKNVVRQILMTSLPAIGGVVFILSDDALIRGLGLLTMIGMLWLVYFRWERFDLGVILE
jgi:O-antigen/teichoic acid export membrane protein